MNRDISEILDSWDYNPKSEFIRKIIGDDGREKIQIRVNLGILQMEADGRPDGKMPHGEKSLLEYYESLISKLKRLDGTSKTLILTDEDMKEIDIEIMQYYNRRVCFFALYDYTNAKRDAEHNLYLMDIIKEHCKDSEYVESHERYRPFVIMERTRAAGLDALKDQNYATAMEYVTDAMERIQNFHRERGIGEEDLNRSHEIILLRKWREKIHQDWEGGVTDMNEDGL